MRNQQPLQIKASDETLRGLYSNLAQIQHTREEFVLDFLNVFPPTGTLNARVIMSPGHMKRLAAALADNLSKYEAAFGRVEVVEPPVVSPIGFTDK